MKLRFNSALIAFILLMIMPGTMLAQQTPLLTERSRISVITFGPYQGELWSVFGHTGVRVYDPILGIDWMYDWGRFDFNQRNFFWNFARGKLLYSIGRTRDFGRYKDYYIQRDRYVYEQVLNLTLRERQGFFEALEDNYLPQNREYLYNYVYDNCATRAYDLTVEVLGDSVYFPMTYRVADKTVRDLMDDYLDYQPWGDLIIDIGLGSQIDREAPAQVYMFLPEYIYRAFAEATLQRNGQPEPLVMQTNKIYESQNKPEAVGLFTPFNTFLILFFVVGLITNRDFKKQKRSRWLDHVLFTLVGIFGWWLVFLWVGTDHLSKANWNLLWAFPLHIPLVYLTGKAKWRYPLSRLYRFLAVLLALTLVFWLVIPQPLNTGLVPLVMTLILRSAYISYDLDRI